MKKLPKTVMVKKPPGSTLSSSKPPPPPPTPRKKVKSRYILLMLIGIAAVIAMVAVPVVLVRKKVGVPVTYVDPDKIPTKIPFDLSKISMEDRNRINCFLESESRYENLTRYQCETVRSCTFKPIEYDRVPDCYFRRELLGYELIQFNSQDNVESYHLRRSKIGNATYLEPIEYLILTVEYLSNNMIHLKIEDENDPNRYQIPYELNKPELIDNKLNSKVKFTHSVDSNKLFQFKITRASDNEIIFDTTMGAFVYHNQFIQISTRLSSPYIYGFGENNHPKLLHDLNFRSWGMWARDNAPGWGDNRNLYGFQPVYYSINEKNQKSHLVLLYNSNAMEYLFTPTPSLTLRTIGGILDFYFVVDDVPETIFQTYHNLIGKPIFPPYWSLGFQICRWGYQKLDDVKVVVNRTNAISLPQDVQYIDIEYMIGYRILTINQLNFSGLSTYQQELENKGIKLVLIEDPGLVIERNNSYYMNGISRKDGGIYTKWPQNLAPYDKDALNKDDMISWCWPNGKLSFPDYLYEDTHLWWEESLRDFMAPSSIQAGNGSNMAGVWIDMNEPSSFETNEIRPWNWLWPDNDQDRYPHFTLKCPVNKYDDPPYRTKNAFAFDSADLLNKKARLSQKTLCMIATQRHKGKEYLHYDVHNLYGHSQSIATFNAMKNIKGTRPFVLTRSNFVGTGHYAAHWLGDNESKWEHMRMSIIGLIEYNIFGFAMIGADICGFFGDVRDAEMCTRWLQLGAFYTLSRNHNANENRDKDPASFNDPILEESTRSVYHIRYTILPYIYTILYNTHRYGGTAIKALHFEFPQDKNTYSIDEQFLLGKALLVSPVLYPNKTDVNAYLPPARWYDYRTGVEELTKGQRTFSAPLDYIPLHLRGGTVVPIQFPDGCLNTVCSRSKPLGVIVSLDENQSASGDFYWDEGETLIDFNDADDNEYFYARYKFENQVLELNVEHNYDGVTGAKLNDIWIYGLSVSNPSIEIGGSILEAGNVAYNQELKVLKLQNLELPIANGFKVEIKTQRSIHIKKAL